MIQSLPPPPPAICVKATEIKIGSSFLTVSGEPSQLTAFLVETAREPRWVVVADATSNGARFVRLKADINIPYRAVGGLIYAAQVRGLAVAMTTDPAICPVEDQ